MVRAYYRIAVIGQVAAALHCLAQVLEDRRPLALVALVATALTLAWLLFNAPPAENSP